MRTRAFAELTRWTGIAGTAKLSLSFGPFVDRQSWSYQGYYGCGLRSIAMSCNYDDVGRSLRQGCAASRQDERRFVEG